MVERVQLANLPTPVEFLPHLTSSLGGPDLFIKRDDLTGLGMGGNKTRKLEFLVGDALAKGCKTLISTGAVQSNHCRQVAAAAAKTGLSCILVLAGQAPEKVQGNLLLDELSGAQIFFIEKEKRDQALQEHFMKAEMEGLKPYLIPYGGSNPIGALGYLHAMEELAQQKISPDWIIFASSSGGTQAGLILGGHKTDFKGKIVGISIEHKTSVFVPEIAALVNQTANTIDCACQVSIEDILINDSYCKAGYGVLTQAEVDAIRLFAQKEGILLDPVYTGRTAAGLLDLIRTGYLKKGEKVLFWHTGGTPALFAEPYSERLLQA